MNKLGFSPQPQLVVANGERYWIVNGRRCLTRFPKTLSARAISLTLPNGEVILDYLPPG